MSAPDGSRTPEEILRLTPTQAGEMIGWLEERVPVRAPLERLVPGAATEAIVFGDSHGDWRSVLCVVERFRADGALRLLIGTGDYVDRTPADSGAGSVANALYLLQVAAESPSQVILCRGNHETVREIPVWPTSLREEVEGLWGPDSGIYERLVGLLNRGPLAATTPNGVYLAHAGFPRAPRPRLWTDAFDPLDRVRLSEIVWAECDASRNRRGVVPPFHEAEFTEFLGETGLTFMLRGHDPDLLLRPIYGGRCITLHTTRVYERFGGVVLARVPLDRRVRTLADLTIEHLATEGKRFPAPG